MGEWGGEDGGEVGDGRGGVLMMSFVVVMVELLVVEVAALTVISVEEEHDLDLALWILHHLA